jgi:hypothetical protein
MSIASVAGYLTSFFNGNANNDPDKVGYTFNVAKLSANRPNDDVYLFINDVVIPKGRWLVSGTIGVTAVDNATDSITAIELILDRGVGNLYNPLYNITASGFTSAIANYSSSVNTFISPLVFVSDGTNKLKGTIKVNVIGAGSKTWFVDTTPSYCFVTFIKIAN